MPHPPAPVTTCSSLHPPLLHYPPLVPALTAVHNIPYIHISIALFHYLKTLASSLVHLLSPSLHSLFFFTTPSTSIHYNPLPLPHPYPFQPVFSFTLIMHISPLFSFLVLAILALSSSLAASQNNIVTPHPYFATVCLSISTRCNWFYAKYSGVGCIQGKPYYAQPRSCTDTVCTWCRARSTRSLRFPCGTPNVFKMCGLYGPGYTGPEPQLFPTTSPKPVTASDSASYPPAAAPKPMPQQMMTPPKPPATKSTGMNKGCVWTGDGDKIVIDLGKVPLPTGWDRCRRNGKTGMIFNRSPAKHISPPGRYGKVCFKVKPPMSGTYYFTGVTYAPHHTEHNDVWVESGYGFELWQRGRKNQYVQPGKWLKAYQNNGHRKGMAETLSTIDFNSHRFLIPNVVKGQTFNVCLSGRSKKYEVYQLVLIRCSGMLCKGYITSGLLNMAPSKCM